MGILEFHFHESEFKFAPSISNTSGDEADPVESSDDSRSTVPESRRGASGRKMPSAGNAKRGVGVLLGLAFLIGIGTALKRFADRRMGGEEHDELDTATVEESIEIAD